MTALLEKQILCSLFIEVSMVSNIEIELFGSFNFQYFIK